MLAKAGVMAEGKTAALSSKESLCSCPEEVKGRETSGNVNICPETEPPSQTPTPSSLSNQTFSGLFISDGIYTSPSQRPISGLVEQMGCLGHLHLWPRLEKTDHIPYGS